MLNLGDAAGRIALDGGLGDRKRVAGVDVLGVILALPVGQFDNAARPSSRASKKGDGETHLQIGHGCAGGGPRALETTQAVRFGAQLRSRPGARGTIACLTAWEWDYEVDSWSVKTEIPDKAEIPATVVRVCNMLIGKQA
jgi:hypothetical protein